MSKKILPFIVSALASISLLTALLLLLGSMRTQAATLPSPRTGLTGGLPAQQQTYTPALTITLPIANAILTTVQPIYAVQVKYDCGTLCVGSALLDVVSVTVNSGVTYHEAISGIVPGRYAYNWTLPSEDYVSHVLIAQARNGWGNVGRSEPVTVHVDTVAPTATTPLDGGTWSSTSTLVFAWAPSADGAGIAGYAVNVTGSDGFTHTTFTSAEMYTITAAESITEGVAYHARLQASDKSGNQGDYGPASDGITPDLTPPLITSAIITEFSNYLHAVGDHLYYTNTMQMGENHSFWIGGTATDTLSGLERATFSPAFGDTPPDDPSPAHWEAGYDVSRADSGDGAITATLYDKASHATSWAFPYELDGMPPTSIVTAPSTWQGLAPIPVEWQAEDTQSGVARTRLHYRRVPTDTEWQYSGLEQIGLSGTFHFTPGGNLLASGSLTYYLAAQATDNLSNVTALPTTGTQVVVKPARIYLPLVMRNYPPQPVGNVVIEDGANHVYHITVTLTLSASVKGDVDVVSQMRLRNGGEDWGAWEPYAKTKSWSLANGISGLRAVYVQFQGSKGGVSGPASDTIYLAWNGDFEAGWAHWTHGRGPFGGNGSGLDQSIVSFEGSNRALLGHTTYQDGSIPVGYAYIAQDFAVPDGNPTLSLQYRVHSRDTVWGETTQKYFDTFELSINRPPKQISDGERDNQGCRDPSRLNPTGTLAPSGDGLVFCGGQPPTTPPNEWNSGWRTVTLDLSAFSGHTITLYIATWSREYNSPFFNDQGYFNTYSYVDNVNGQGD